MTDEAVAVELATIKTVVLRMEGRLFGEDGNGGTVEKVERRLGHLEATEAKARGVLWTLGGLFTLVTGTLMRHLFSGGK